MLGDVRQLDDKQHLAAYIKVSIMHPIRAIEIK